MDRGGVHLDRRDGDERPNWECPWGLACRGSEPSPSVLLSELRTLLLMPSSFLSLSLSLSFQTLLSLCVCFCCSLIQAVSYKFVKSAIGTTAFCCVFLGPMGLLLVYVICDRLGSKACTGWQIDNAGMVHLWAVSSSTDSFPQKSNFSYSSQPPQKKKTKTKKKLLFFN